MEIVWREYDCINLSADLFGHKLGPHLGEELF